MFSFLFVDLFDSLGTLIGVASKADMLDEEGKLPNIKGALMADSIAIGVISWTLLNLITGKAKEKKISPLMYVLTVLFILKYVLL